MKKRERKRDSHALHGMNLITKQVHGRHAFPHFPTIPSPFQRRPAPHPTLHKYIISFIIRSLIMHRQYIKEALRGCGSSGGGSSREASWSRFLTSVTTIYEQLYTASAGGRGVVSSSLLLLRPLGDEETEGRTDGRTRCCSKRVSSKRLSLPSSSSSLITHHRSFLFTLARSRRRSSRHVVMLLMRVPIVLLFVSARESKNPIRTERE